ncbi:Chitin synthesis regulation, Congo red resistance, RCR protein [Metarhizium album ARSEF 1941]|uniref:Chitin synthesis regulation, Congo red resistance, RCR protein n=1 Tax=Metarhizium album (strain ARSEF 1941) TaxID=1081103 RepID=A0A0B2WS13_METAS|nr:Chitin synthesis regulation, Congo red resistance, RCR protein [Metarhizium album ARSEF 1941]KHN96439.1 Chitin synthesis regulation, Congo red resistance, RCR protein [Metarhizium album ARSEF 1941]
MAPAAVSGASPGSAVTGLVKRALYCNSYGYTYRCNSRWYDWGRWVVLAGIIVVFVLIMFTCACTARRRRRRGAQPMYGTGWMAPAGKFGNNQQHQMNSYNQGYAQPQGYYNTPPPYGQQQAPQNTGTTFNPNDGYYGHQQQYGVQQPPNTYQPDGGYAPPPGPPPGK